MKKLFVILLAVALTLSLAVVASAATFSPYVGGEFQLTYRSNGGTSPFSLDSGSFSMMKAYVQGKVEDADTNTWAQIGAKLTCWSAPGFDLLYSAGIKKVGGILDIQYSTDDYETTLRGLTPLWSGGVAKFGGDPFFTNRLGNAFGFDANTDNVIVNFGIDANGDPRKMVLAGTFKFDAGKVYVGYAKVGQVLATVPGLGGLDKTQMIVGGEFKAGAMTIKADYTSANKGYLGHIAYADGADKDIDAPTVARTEDGSSFQATVSLDEMKLAATLLYDMNYELVKSSTEENNIGLGVEYSGIDKLTVGLKYFTTKPDAGMEVYGIYKYGIFDIKPGYAKMGAADGYFYVAMHAGLW